MCTILPVQTVYDRHHVGMYQLLICYYLTKHTSLHLSNLCLGFRPSLKQDYTARPNCLIIRFLLVSPMLLVPILVCMFVDLCVSVILRPVQLAEGATKIAHSPIFNKCSMNAKLLKVCLRVLWFLVYIENVSSIIHYSLTHVLCDTPIRIRGLKMN